MKESLTGYASSSASTNVFAEPMHDFYLTLKDLRGWFLEDCLTPILPDLKEKSLVLMGLAEKGRPSRWKGGLRPSLLETNFESFACLPCKIYDICLSVNMYDFSMSAVTCSLV